MKRDVEELRKKSLGRVLRAMNTNVVICCQMDSAEKATFSEVFLFCTEQSSDSAILQHKKLADNKYFYCDSNLTEI